MENIQCARAVLDITNALDDWVRIGSQHVNDEHASTLHRMRSQTQVMTAFEREKTEDRYTRQFEGNFSCDALHKIRVGNTSLIFQGRRESAQLVGEDEGREGGFRESCHCLLRDAITGRVLWEFRAEETTIDQQRIQLAPQIDAEAISEFIHKVGCPALSGSEAVTFLVCLAGERVTEYFQWQIMRELDRLICAHAHQSCSVVHEPVPSSETCSDTCSETLLETGSAKRKWNQFDDESMRSQRQRMSPLISVLGKRGRETDALFVHRHHVVHTV